MFLTTKLRKACFVGLTLSLASLLNPCFADPTPNALPTGASSIVGNVQFNQAGNTLNVSSAADRSIARYETFNVGQNATVNFNLPSASSAILNRVAGGTTSEIFGKINSNGQVFLLNPNGIIFGRTAEVNASSLVASTLGIRNQDFLNGNINVFREVNGQSPSFIKNRGKITTNGGSAVFLTGSFENTGKIRSINGNVLVGIGEVINVPVESGIFVNVEVKQGLNNKAEGFGQAISNTSSGLIEALNGDVKMVANLRNAVYDRAVNNEGNISATAAVFNPDGSITLSPGGKVDILAEGKQSSIDSRGLIQAQDISLDSSSAIIIGGSGLGTGTAILGTGGGDLNIAAGGDINIRSKVENTNGNITLASGRTVSIADANLTERTLLETIGTGDISILAGKKINVGDGITTTIGDITLDNVYYITAEGLRRPRDFSEILDGGIYITAPIKAEVGDINILNQNLIDIFKDVSAAKPQQTFTAKADIVIRDEIVTGEGNVNVISGNNFLAETKYDSNKDLDINLNLLSQTFVGEAGLVRTSTGDINFFNYNSVNYNTNDDPSNSITPGIELGGNLNVNAVLNNEQVIIGRVINDYGYITFDKLNTLAFAGPVETEGNANFNIQNLNSYATGPSAIISAPLGIVDILTSPSVTNIDDSQFNIDGDLNINVTP